MSFSDDLGADSLEIIEMIIALEDEFEVEISESASDTIHIVTDAVRHIENARKHR